MSGTMDSATITDETRPLAEDQATLVMGRYRLLKRLGSGGFGVVWEAFDEKLERSVAVKEVPTPAGADRRRRRAIQEARAAARLNHPNIVALHEYGQEGDSIYLVSELVKGQTLDDILSVGAASDREIALIGLNLCHALASAHSAGVIHRDVKPQNVMVTAGEDGGIHNSKLMDFGIAHVASGDRLTGTGDVLGTLLYMSPEQARGMKVSEASDVYSLSLTLYEAWAGRNPAGAGSPEAALKRIGKRLPSLSRKRRDLPDELVCAVDCALEPYPEHRIGVEELAEALDASMPLLDDHAPGPSSRPGLWVGGLPQIQFNLRLVGRLFNAAAVGAMTLGSIALSGLFGAGELAVGGAVAAAAAYVLPRLSWFLAASALIAAAATSGAAGPGLALLLVAAFIPVMALLAGAGRVWSLPALAPLLGAAGLAPLFLGLAGFLRSAYTRAAVAALGAWWLMLAEVATKTTLFYGSPSGAWHLERFQHSALATVEHGIVPILGPALGTALIWSSFAIVMPLFVRGRNIVPDLAGAILWGAAFIMASRGLGELMAGRLPSPEPRGLMLATLLYVGLVVAFHLARRGRAS